MQVAGRFLRQQHHALVPWLVKLFNAVFTVRTLGNHPKRPKRQTQDTSSLYFLSAAFAAFQRMQGGPVCLCVLLRAVICLPVQLHSSAEQLELPGASICLSALMPQGWATFTASTSVMLYQVSDGPLCCGRQLRHCARRALT